MNHAVRKIDPFFFRQELHQVAFDFDSDRFCVGKTKATAEPADMRIDDDPRGQPIAVPKHHIGRFATNSGQRDERPDISLGTLP